MEFATDAGRKEAPPDSEIWFGGLTRAILESALDCIIVMDASGRVLEFNPAAERVFGFTRAEAIGEELAELIVPRALRERHRNGLKRYLETGQRTMLGRRVEIEAVRADGSHILVELAITVFRMKGAPIFTAYLRDITSRNLAEEKLRLSEERFRELAENIHEVFWMSDPANTQLLYISPAYETIWGRSRESLYAFPTSWMDAIHSEDREQIVQLRAKSDPASPRDNTYRITRPDGSIRWIRDRGFPVRDEIGAVVRFAGIAEDITVSKTSAEALARAEKQYRSIFNNAVDGIFRTSPDGKLLVANPAAARIFGFASPEESIAARSDVAQAYVDPRRREELKRLLQEHDSVKGFEFEAYRKDGSRVWISENTRAVRSPSGEIEYFEGIFEDVTDRKRAEAELWEENVRRRLIEDELRQSEARFRLMFEKSAIGMALMTVDSVFHQANAAFCALLGRTEKEVIGYKTAEFTHPEDIAKSLNPPIKVREDGVQIVDLEKRYLRKDGATVWAHVTAVLHYDEEARPLYWIAIIEDISERKRAEDALRESEERFRTIFEQAPLGISEGEIATARFINANQRYIDILGYTLDELRNLTFKHYSHPDDLPKDLVEFQKLAAGEIRTYSMEKRYIRKDGAIIWVNLTVSALGNPGEKPLTCIAVIDDITDRIQAEEALSAQALRYKTLLATSTDSIYVINKDGDLQEANAAFLRRRGYADAQVKELNVADWDVQWDRKALRERLRKLVGSSAVFETRHRSADGSIFDVEVCATGVEIDGEQLFFCVTRDISERKQAEEALRRSEEKWKALFDLAPVGISVLDRNHNVVDVNRALEKITQLSREELLNGSWRRRTYLNGDATPSSPEKMPTVRAVAEKRPVNDVETGIISENGEIIWTRVSVAPLELPDASAVVITQDITERKRDQTALRESEQQMRLFMEATADCLWRLDLTTGKVVRSVGFNRVFGYAVEEVDSSLTWWEERLHPNDRAKVLSTFQDAISSGSNTCSYQYRFRCKDGSLAVIHDRAYIVRDASGKPLSALGAMTDITERELAAEKLWQSVALSHAISEGATEAIFAKDINGRYQMINTAGARLVGRMPEEVVGSTDADLFSAEDSRRITEQDREVLRTGQIRTFDENASTAETSRIYNTTKGPIRDSKGEVIGLWGVARDITERKREEQKLRESEERFRQMADNINEVFWIETTKPQRLLFVSRAYETLWGRSRESLYASPTSWRESIHPDDREHVIETAESQATQEFDITYRITRPDQSVRWIRERAFPVRNEDGVVVRMAGVANDITKSKEAADALERANQQLSFLSRHRTQVQEKERRYLARELHDQIGQALTAAKINVQSAQRSTKREMVTKYLEDTVSILDEILDQARRISLQLRPPVLDDLGLAPALRWALADYAQRAGWSAQFFADPHLGRAHADTETACFRVVQEALTNIARHAGAQQVWVELHESEEVLHLLVRDDGAGFDPRDMQKRGHGERLGLIGMRERVSAVGGTFECQSAPGAGTVVEAFFPMASNLMNGE
jgi:PAS domain S-box-containing protein